LPESKIFSAANPKKENAARESGVRIQAFEFGHLGATLDDSIDQAIALMR
jgi:hypothetical protein